MASKKQNKPANEQLETQADADAHGSDEAHEAHEDGHEHDEHHADEAEHDDAGVDAEDPTWWAPHAVLVTLLFVGISSMLGLFNPLVAKYTHRASSHDTATHGAGKGHGDGHGKGAGDHAKSGALKPSGKDSGANAH